MGEDGEIVLGEGLNALMGVLGAGRGGPKECEVWVREKRRIG